MTESTAGRRVPPAVPTARIIASRRMPATDAPRPAVAPSCEDCIFRVDRRTVVAEAGQDLGVDVCAQGFGPIGLPMLDGPAAHRAMARDCPSFQTEGERQPILTSRLTRTPIFDLLEETGPELSAAKAVDSCLACQNFVTPAAMFDEGLWPVAACAATGRMLLPSMYRQRPKTCGKRALGLRPLVRETFDKRLRLAEPWSNLLGTTVIDTFNEGDALPEITDGRAATPEEVASGIASWVKIANPANPDQFTYLPRFDPAYFSESEQAAIPRTGDDEHPENYVDHMGLAYRAAVLWMELNETPSLVGVAGSGKTEAFRYFAWLMQIPFHRISITASTEVEDLAGKMHYEPSRGTYFEYGRIPNAWMKPGVICLDEPNVGPPDVWQFIRPLTDNSKQLVLDMNSGERISRHPHAFLGMAMNPAWDIKNSGTASLADADGSRLMHIFVDFPSPAIERKIIAERVALDGWTIDRETLDMVMRIAKDLRALCDEDTLPITWGMRPQLKVARALRWFTPQQAYRLAAADYLEPSQQEVVMDVVKAHAPAPVKRPTGPRLRSREERNG